MFIAKVLEAIFGTITLMLCLGSLFQSALGTLVASVVNSKYSHTYNVPYFSGLTVWFASIGAVWSQLLGLADEHRIVPNGLYQQNH